MCGIVGVAGNTLQRDMKIFRDMLIFDQIRGLDSTGVTAVTNAKSEVLVEKELDGPDNLWNRGDSKIFDWRGVGREAYQCMIGHNRAATIGNVIRDNAHPFTFEHITGVHNGSLHDWWDLERDEDGKKFEVDSKALLKTIAIHGIDETWKKFSGAASLVWWDSRDNTLNFIRNEERPMYLAWNEAGSILLFASEHWMIDIAASRHNLKLKTHEDTRKDQNGNDYKYTYRIYPTKTDHYFKFKVTPTSVTLVEDRELEKKKSGVSYTTTTYGKGTQQNNQPLKFNSMWAKGLEKGDRDNVGREFIFKHQVQRYVGGVLNPYFVGEMLDGNKERVEIYPKTVDEYNDFLDENEHKRRRYVLGCRPRVIHSATGMFWAFAIEVNNIKYAPTNNAIVDLHPPVVNTPTFKDVVDQINKAEIERKGEVVQLYRTLGNRMVTEDEWRRNMKDLGGCCDFCGVSIALQEHDSCLWYNNGVICPSCKDDESYKACMNM